MGLTGGNDPDNRRCFPWDPAEQDSDLLGHFRTLGKLRKRLPELRRGSFRRVLLDQGANTYAFVRELNRESTLVVLNCSTSPRSIKLSTSQTGLRKRGSASDFLNERRYITSGSTIAVQLKPLSAAIIK